MTEEEKKEPKDRPPIDDTQDNIGDPNSNFTGKVMEEFFKKTD